MRDMNLHHPVLEMDLLGGAPENVFGLMGPPDLYDEFGLHSNPDDLKRTCMARGCQVQASAGSSICSAHMLEFTQRQRTQQPSGVAAPHSQQAQQKTANGGKPHESSESSPNLSHRSGANVDESAPNAGASRAATRCSSIGCPGQAQREGLCAFHFHAQKVGQITGYEGQFSVPFAVSDAMLGAYDAHQQHANMQFQRESNEGVEQQPQRRDEHQRAAMRYQAEQHRRALEQTIRGQHFSGATAHHLWQQAHQQAAYDHPSYPFSMDVPEGQMGKQFTAQAIQNLHGSQSIAHPGQLSGAHPSFFGGRCHQPLCERSAVAGGLCSLHSSRMCRHAGCTRPATASSSGSSEYMYCSAHAGEFTCKEPSCNNPRRGISGFCQLHIGARKCQHNNCTRPASTVGVTTLCKTHGGGRRCDHPGCLKFPQGPSGLCIQHGGGKRCRVPGCKKAARGTTNNCMRHGGGKRCSHDGCSKAAAAVGVKNLCVAHGGGHRCKEPGCTKSARAGPSGFCAAHGGGRQCKYAGGCTKYDIGWGYCKRHGGGKRCSLVGCNLPAKGSKGLCVAHLNLSGMGNQVRSRAGKSDPAGMVLHRQSLVPAAGMGPLGVGVPEGEDATAWLRNSGQYGGQYGPVLGAQGRPSNNKTNMTTTNTTAGHENTQKLGKKRKSLQFDEDPSIVPSTKKR